MRFVLEFSEPDDGEASDSLFAWLAGDPMAATVSIDRRRPSPQPGQLGSLTDALIVAVGSGGSLTILMSSIRAWITLPRHSHIKLKILTEHPGQRTIEIDADRIRSTDIAQIVHDLQERDEDR